MTILADELAPDELWALVKSLLPVHRGPLWWRASRHPRPGLFRRDRVHGAHLHLVGQGLRQPGQPGRYERRGDLLTAFLHLACALICVHRLGRVDLA